MARWYDARWYDGSSRPHGEPYTGPAKGQHTVIPKPEPKPVPEPDGESVEKYTVEFTVSLDGEELHREDVFARNRLTAVARAAWNTALKGYSLFEVRSVTGG